jgi:hypothetical protein
MRNKTAPAGGHRGRQPRGGFTPQMGAMGGSEELRITTSADPNLQCDLKTQLAWALQILLIKMAPACVAPEPLPLQAGSSQGEQKAKQTSPKLSVRKVTVRVGTRRPFNVG